jgi:hypothetical protein
VWWCRGCGGVGVWWCGCVVMWGGWLVLAFEHSKVCTLCDFGHLQFLNKEKKTEAPFFVAKYKKMCYFACKDQKQYYNVVL